MATLKDFSRIIEQTYPLRITVHARSKPGTGKTEVTHQTVARMAKAYNEPFGIHPVHLSCLDSIDAEGIRYVERVEVDGKIIPISAATRSPLLPPLNAPRRGFVFLDELMQATQDVLKPVARFIHERKIGDHSLPPGWGIICASNRHEDKSGVVRGMSFLTNRQLIVDIDGNLDGWVEWAMANEVHPYIIGFVKFKKGDVFSAKVPDDPDVPFMTPRSIVQAGRVLTVVDDLMLASIAVTGLVGKGSAAELMAFIRMADQLPSYEQIVAKPKSTPVPKAPDACYAVTQMIASRVQPEDALAVFTWLEGLPKEFQVTCLKDSMARPDLITGGLMSNPAFHKWVQKNSHIVLEANS